MLRHLSIQINILKNLKTSLSLFSIAFVIQTYPIFSTRESLKKKDIYLINCSIKILICQII